MLSHENRFSLELKLILKSQQKKLEKLKEEYVTN